MAEVALQVLVDDLKESNKEQWPPEDQPDEAGFGGAAAWKVLRHDDGLVDGTILGDEGEGAGEGAAQWWRRGQRGDR